MDARTWQNIYNCTTLDLRELTTVPNLTSVILLTGTKVDRMSAELIQQIRQLKTVKIINMTNNEIRHVSESIKDLENMEEIWMAGNPFQCYCWMFKWLQTFENISQTYLVKDYRDVTCKKGSQTLKVFGGDLGCNQGKWTTAQIVGVSVAALFITIVFVLTVISLKRSREVKCLLFYYLRLDTVPKDDKDENLENFEHDAFLCFW